MSGLHVGRDLLQALKMGNEVFQVWEFMQALGLTYAVHIRML